MKRLPQLGRDLQPAAIAVQSIPVPVIVLHHGILGFGNFNVGPIRLRYFAGAIERSLAEAFSMPIVPARVHPTAAIETRAAQLKSQIIRQSAKIGDEKLIIVAHSMGGLDARYMISHLGMADRVAAVLTIATPHRGAAYADWWVRNAPARLSVAVALRHLRLDLRSVIDLTTESMRRFNARTPDAAGVRYFSVNCAQDRRRIPTFFRHAYDVTFAHDGENDGVVSLATAEWGELVSTWQADHLHQINKHYDPLRMAGKSDIAPMYVDAVAEVLRRCGPSSHNVAK